MHINAIPWTNTLFPKLNAVEKGSEDSKMKDSEAPVSRKIIFIFIYIYGTILAPLAMKQTPPSQTEYNSGLIQANIHPLGQLAMVSHQDKAQDEQNQSKIPEMKHFAILWNPYHTFGYFLGQNILFSNALLQNNNDIENQEELLEVHLIKSVFNKLDFQKFVLQQSSLQFLSLFNL